MAENRLPRAIHKLIAHARHQARACAKWQDTLGLTHVRAGRLGRAAATARAAEKELRAAHAHWSASRSERRRLDLESWDFIAHARACLMPALGRKWSPEWQLVGFTRHRLRVPERFADREQLLESLADVLEAHPEWEHTKSGLTAAAVRARYDALTSADTDYTSSRTRLRRARRGRDTAVTALNRTLRALKKELRLVIDPADPLWLEFNLNPPSRRRKAKAKAVAPAAPAPSFGVPASAGTASENPTEPATFHATQAPAAGASACGVPFHFPKKTGGNLPGAASPQPSPPSDGGEGARRAGEEEPLTVSTDSHRQLASFKPPITDSESAFGVPPSGGRCASEPSEGGTPNSAPRAWPGATVRTVTSLPAGTDARSASAGPIPSAGRRSLWDLLRAGARKITWNLF